MNERSDEEKLRPRRFVLVPRWKKELEGEVLKRLLREEEKEWSLLLVLWYEFSKECFDDVFFGW